MNGIGIGGRVGWICLDAERDIVGFGGFDQHFDQQRRIGGSAGQHGATTDGDITLRVAAGVGVIGGEGHIHRNGHVWVIRKSRGHCAGEGDFFLGGCNRCNTRMRTVRCQQTQCFEHHKRTDAVVDATADNPAIGQHQRICVDDR